MKTWDRAPIAQACGACGHRLAVGEPRLRLTLRFLDGPTLERVRCATCAGEPPPADLAPYVPVPPAPITPVPKASATKRLPLLADQLIDLKTRATGDREPGEEG